MRLTLGALVAVALLGVPLAAAAELDPSALVLRKSDVPAGFEVDRADTGLRTNAIEATSDSRLRSLFARWGRVTGYEAEFDRPGASIGSRADILRTSEGARKMLDWFVLEMRKSGIRGLHAIRPSLGAEGWMFVSRTPASFAVVTWRSGRVFAGVGATGISSERTLALARVQQRRIAAALR